MDNLCIESQFFNSFLPSCFLPSFLSSISPPSLPCLHRCSLPHMVSDVKYRGKKNYWSNSYPGDQRLLEFPFRILCPVNVWGAEESHLRNRQGGESKESFWFFFLHIPSHATFLHIVACLPSYKITFLGSISCISHEDL